MDKFLCVHAHFYQPPRENPWLEEVQLEDLACPYHDQNAVVAAQCYAPNSAARVLDAEGRILAIVNNYSRISFSFTPGLMAWLLRRDPEVYQAILRADRDSQDRFGGHGSALAQPYAHAILPLAGRRDKYTQALWGIRDFESRFQRPPEGFWLPECAVDLETLEVLADLGIKFTVLAPHQAHRVRARVARSWHDVSGGRIDPTLAYEAELPGGRSIALFFYDAPISNEAAFGDLLASGEQFARRLLDAVPGNPAVAPLVHIATDGETYGYHRSHGDMALAYALDYFDSIGLAQLTNYGRYLEQYPPGHQVAVAGATSRSCAHGLERWRADCGCNTGAHPGWNQAWRAPLRQASDYLHDTVQSLSRQLGSAIFKDPAAARDSYISVVLDRSADNVGRFIARHAVERLDEAGRVRALKLMELERYELMVDDSSGWFFDDISAREALQTLFCAGRVLQLARDISAGGQEEGFLNLLETAKSNLPEFQDGRELFQKLVKPVSLDLLEVAAHYSMGGIFDIYGDNARFYSFHVERDDFHLLRAGETRLGIGKGRVGSTVTGESLPFYFGALHFGDHNVYAGIRALDSEDTYQALVRDASATYEEGDLADVLRVLDRDLGPQRYSLKNVFRDERRRILDLILSSTVAEAEASYRQLYEHHGPLVHFLAELGAPLPKALHAALELVLNAHLGQALHGGETIDIGRVASILEDARRWNIVLDAGALERDLRRLTDPLADGLRRQPGDLALLAELGTVVGMIHSLPAAVNLWRVQNAYYEVLRTVFPGRRQEAAETRGEAQDWVDRFLRLGEMLGFRLDGPTGSKA